MHKKLYGARIRTADGNDVGVVKALVIDPRSKVITHLVVQEGLLFNSDMLIPASVIDDREDTAGTIKLKIAEDELHRQDLRGYDDDEFVSTADEQLKAWVRPLGVGPSVVSYPQVLPPGLGYLASEEDVHIPLEEITLERDSTVVDCEGRTVGNVEECVTDETGAITHFTIAEGGLFKRPVTVPIDWVSRIEDDRIALAVDRTVLEKI